MARFIIAIVLSVILGLALASFPKDWTKLVSAPAESTLTFSIALKQRNIPELERIALDVSDPDSPRYGQHLTHAEVIELVSPPEEHLKIVTDWLDTFNGVNYSSYHDGIRVKATVSALSQMFSAKFYSFQHKTGRKAIRQEGGVTIPEVVAPYIDMVTSLTAFPIISMARPGRGGSTEEMKRSEQQDIKYNSAGSIKNAYNIPLSLKATNAKTIQVAMEFLPEGGIPFSDVQEFSTQSNVLWTNISNIVGPWDTNLDDGESILDVELLNGIGSGVTNWYWTIGDGWSYEMATDLFNRTNGKNPKIVVSVSYGWPEVLTCQSSITHAKCDGGTAQQYVSRSEAELAKLAALGMTVVICTQDEGAPSEANMDWSDQKMPVYSIYPGSSQWVTAVSATTIAPNPNGANGPLPPDNSPICQMSYECDTDTFEYPTEVNNTLYQWTTGGGFSSYISRPSYQSKAVQNFLNNKNALKPPTKLFPSTNRGYADVSAVGDRILIWQGGQLAVSAGTSASTPIFAAIASLLNDYRLNNGKAPLGFLNPLLYKMAVLSPTAFNDVIYGDNRCTRYSTCCKYGYGATTGWDPATGLGSPNFSAMLNFVKSLP